MADYKPLPAPEEFLLEASLYTRYLINSGLNRDHEKGFPRASFILDYSGPLDSYCLFCHKGSVFHGVQTERPTLGYNYYDTLLGNLSCYQKVFRCSRDEQHDLCFFFSTGLTIFIDDKKYGFIQKIGQLPSLADLASSEIQKYRKILGEDRYAEFNRAIGLNAHGVGVGTFVYLRRIFESLVEDAHHEALNDSSWDDSAFQGRMEDQILLLKDWLPHSLVKNRAAYVILSTGIHDLTENECRQYFPILKSSIELILDEKMRKEEQQAKDKEVTDTIGKIKGFLKRGGKIDS